MKIDEQQMEEFLRYIQKDKKVETKLGTFYLRKRKAFKSPDLTGKMVDRKARKYIHYRPTRSIDRKLNP